MSDDALALAQTLVIGMSGSGKTTFALRYLRAAPVACRFIFDDLGVAARKIPGATVCHTSRELEEALPTRWVIFSPVRMFPGDNDGSAFKFFCEWVLCASKRGPGKKLFLVDEIWRWCRPQYIPPCLASLAQMGRVENIELVTCTQRPSLLNESITGQSTEMVFFRLQAPNDLAKAEALSLGRVKQAQIGTLPPGSFIAVNTQTGTTTPGKVF